jgi:hypothetical protein
MAQNLGIESHKSRFSFTENRTINQMPEHPGGQIPTRIDVLENVRLLIYIKHSDEKLLEEMKNALENPKQRIYPIHLGRAEDSVIFEAIDIVELKKKKNPLYGKIKNYDFTWLVDPERGEKYLDLDMNWESYKDFFNKIQGSYHLITSFYKIVEGIRVFEHIPVKLFEGGSFPLYFGKPFEFIFDEDIPLFFAKMVYPEG